MEVDLVICFDANISPLRMIQRMGRTGRKRDGRVDILSCFYLLTTFFFYFLLVKFSPNSVPFTLWYFPCSIHIVVITSFACGSLWFASSSSVYNQVYSVDMVLCCEENHCHYSVIIMASLPFRIMYVENSVDLDHQLTRSSLRRGGKRRLLGKAKQEQSPQQTHG